MRLYTIILLLLWSMHSMAQMKFTSKKSGLGTVTDITHAGDGSQRIFVANKTGTISILDSNYVTLGTLLSLPSSMITVESEKGLLGLAFHPDFKTNGYFFVNYNPANTDHTRISRFTATNPAANSAVSLASEKVIITITEAENSNHKAGDLVFGPDGYLYFGTGDGGGGGDPQGSGQNGNTFLGKIIRLDINTASPYVIPADNPFISNPAVLNEIWDMGMRNPWRISFDRQTGDLWIADVGQGAREEIDFEPAGQGGNNYGWNCREGFNSYNGCSLTSAFTQPIYDYGRCNDPCNTAGLGRSVTGGFVYRGTKEGNASMQGYYIFADYLSRHGWLIKNTVGSASGFRQALEVVTVNKLTTTGGITSFGELENGEIMAGLDNGDLGTIDATAALPIQMLSFQGEEVRGQVRLSWATASEINTLQYTVERGTDGIHFDKIGLVQAQGKAASYQFLDLNPAKGYNYYRLRIEEVDGSGDFTVTIKILHGETKSLATYSRVSGLITLRGDDALYYGPTELYDIQGRLMRRYDSSIRELAVQNLASGIYLLKINGAQEAMVQKLIIY